MSAAWELLGPLALLLGAQSLAMIMPGPNTALLLAVAADRPAALPSVVVGFAAAGLLFSAVSVAVLFGLWSQGFAVARLVAQLAGALWLGHVGVALVRAARRRDAATPRTVPSSRRALFVTGFLTNASNPKTLAFFSSILAIYLARVGASPIAVGAAVGAIFANSLAVHGALGWLLSGEAVRRGYARWGTPVRFLAGAAFVGFAGAFGASAVVGLVETFGGSA